MKRIRTILIASLLCLAGLSLQAQDRWIYSAELTAGVGFKQGPLFFVTPQFTAQYPLGGGFTAGAGVGFRIGRPCYQYTVSNGSGSRSFRTELDIPLYLRFGYGKEHFFKSISLPIWMRAMPSVFLRAIQETRSGARIRRIPDTAVSSLSRSWAGNSGEKAPWPWVSCCKEANSLIPGRNETALPSSREASARNNSHRPLPSAIVFCSNA